MEVEPLLLAPGERADVLIDFSKLKADRTIRMTNNAVAPFPSRSRSVRKGGQPLRDIMQFTVTDTTGFTGKVPTTLRGGSGQPPRIATLSTPSVIRNLLLVEILDPTTGNPVMLLLNNIMWKNDD